MEYISTQHSIVVVSCCLNALKIESNKKDPQNGKENSLISHIRDILYNISYVVAVGSGQMLGGSSYSDTPYSDISKWVMQRVSVRVMVRIRVRVWVRVSTSLA